MRLTSVTNTSNINLMTTTNNERDDHDARATVCDECGCLVECGERANPADMAEVFCGGCWPAVQLEMTARIPVETMAQVVFGGGQ